MYRHLYIYLMNEEAYIIYIYVYIYNVVTNNNTSYPKTISQVCQAHMSHQLRHPNRLKKIINARLLAHSKHRNRMSDKNHCNRSRSLRFFFLGPTAIPSAPSLSQRLPWPSWSGNPLWVACRSSPTSSTSGWVHWGSRPLALRSFPKIRLTSDTVSNFGGAA